MNGNDGTQRKVQQTCTWQDEALCQTCENNGMLHCRWNAGDLFLFIAVAAPGVLGAMAGAVLIGLSKGAWWPLIGYILFFLLVMGVGETRFLCCHCPYYARSGPVLHCLANHGLLRIWRYRPQPMNRIEKALMVAFITVFLLIPVVVVGYDVAYFASAAGVVDMVGLAAIVSLAAVTIASMITFAAVLLKYFCVSCVNFSCPLNRVDAQRRNVYLDRNPAMKRAWEQAGYCDNEGSSSISGQEGL